MERRTLDLLQIAALTFVAAIFGIFVMQITAADAFTLPALEASDGTGQIPTSATGTLAADAILSIALPSVATSTATEYEHSQIFGPQPPIPFYWYIVAVKTNNTLYYSPLSEVFHDSTGNTLTINLPPGDWKQVRVYYYAPYGPTLCPNIADCQFLRYAASAAPGQVLFSTASGGVGGSGTELPSTFCRNGDTAYSTANSCTAGSGGSVWSVISSGWDSEQWHRFDYDIGAASITNAVLRVPKCTEGNGTIEVYRMRRRVANGGNFNNWSTSNPWTTNGGKNTSSDRYATPMGSLEIELNCGSEDHFDIELDPSEVEAMLNDGIQTLGLYGNPTSNLYWDTGAGAATSVTLIVNAIELNPAYDAQDAYTFSGTLPGNTSSTSYFTDLYGPEGLCGTLMTTSSWLGVTFAYPTGSGIVDCASDLGKYLVVPSQEALGNIANKGDALGSRTPFSQMQEASEYASDVIAALVFDVESASSTGLAIPVPQDWGTGGTMELLPTPAALSESAIGTSTLPIARTASSFLNYLALLWYFYRRAMALVGHPSQAVAV